MAIDEVEAQTRFGEKMTDELAIISPCETYRYWLRRPLAVWGKSVCFVMLNPSTADAEVDDPTIRRCIGFAQAWSGRELIVVNLFAYRATDPADLKKACSPIGPDNDAAIDQALERCDLVVAAWGNHGLYKNRADNLRRRIRATDNCLHYLKLTGKGQPSHPLYLNASLQPMEW